MNIADLKTELTLDPLDRGYDAMSDDAVADALNDVAVAASQPLTSADLLAWSAINGRFDRIEQACDHASPVVRSLAGAAMLLIQRDAVSLDLSQPDRLALLDALVAADVLSEDERDELISRSEVLISRANQLGLGRVLTHHITKARAH